MSDRTASGIHRCTRCGHPSYSTAAAQQHSTTCKAQQ